MAGHEPAQRRYALTYLDHARTEIDTATDLLGLKETHDRLAAVCTFCKAAKVPFEIIQRCSELKIRCERRAGELLSSRERHPPGPPPQDKSLVATYPPRLEDLHITTSQSSKWQSIATIPERDFEGKIDEIKKHGREITTSEMLAFGQYLDRERNRTEQRRAAAPEAVKVQPDKRIRVVQGDLLPRIREKSKNLTARENIKEITHRLESMIEYVKELEDLKSRLTEKFLAHTVRFDKEFEYYREIWDSIVELREHIFRLRCTVSYRAGRPDMRRADKEQLLEAIEKFCFAFEKNRPFFSPEVYKVLVELRHLKAVEEELTYSYLPAPTPEQNDTIKRLLEEVLIGPADELMKKTDAIEESIRSRIGGE